MIAEKEIALAGDAKRMVPYVGSIEVRFENRVAFTGVVVMGERVLPGANPVEDLFFIPHLHSVDIDPPNPSYAAVLAK